MHVICLSNVCTYVCMVGPMEWVHPGLTRIGTYSSRAIIVPGELHDGGRYDKHQIPLDYYHLLVRLLGNRV